MSMAVAFNVMYKPTIDPSGTHINDASFMKTCLRKPLTPYDDYLYAYLLGTRLRCGDQQLFVYDLNMAKGEYLYASDADS